MKIKIIFSLSILLLTSNLLSGCASLSGAESTQNVEKIKMGMNESQVLNLLGSPDSVAHTDASSDRWIYQLKRKANDGHNLFVDFKEGVTTQSGELSGRDIASFEENQLPGNCTHWKRAEFVEESLCTR